MTIKEMIEKQNDCKDAMTALVNAAQEEAREMTAEEVEEFDALKNTIENYEKTINRIEEVEKMNRRPLEGPKPAPADNERKQFENMLRGYSNAATSDSGRVTIPVSIGEEIVHKVEEICPIYAMAQRYNVTGKLVLVKENGSDLAMSYVTEGTAAGVTGVTFAQNIELDGYLASVLTKVPNSLIVNSAFDIVAYVVQRIAEEVAAFLDKELLTGTTKAKGLASGVTQTITAKAAAAITADELIDTQALVPDAYQANAVWIMNSKTRTAIRKLKDGQGNYILCPDLSAPFGYTLLGKPVYCSDNMPEMAKSAKAIYYGDLSGLAVKVSEELEVNVLQEAFYTEHMTGVCAFIEFDAGVQNPQKLACVVMAAS